MNQNPAKTVPEWARNREELNRLARQGKLDEPDAAGFTPFETALNLEKPELACALLKLGARQDWLFSDFDWFERCFYGRADILSALDWTPERFDRLLHAVSGMREAIDDLRAAKLPEFTRTALAVPEVPRPPCAEENGLTRCVYVFGGGEKITGIWRRHEGDVPVLAGDQLWDYRPKCGRGWAGSDLLRQGELVATMRRIHFC